jgi:hypothetical protein
MFPLYAGPRRGICNGMLGLKTPNNVKNLALANHFERVVISAMGENCRRITSKQTNK